MGAENLAPEGTIWVCAACGRTSFDRVHGPEGWDESCMLKAVLCFERRDADGQWSAVPHGYGHEDDGEAA